MPTKKAPDILPAGAKKIWISAFNGSWKDTCKDRSDRDECAAKIAWSAVKKKYKKSGDKWVKKSEMLKEFSIAIIKASLDKATGEMRWRAVASDTDEDNFGDNMTMTLFNDFIRRIKSNQKAPEVFCSDFWQGGMPYLSVSHYSDNNGKAVPGEIESIYIDGNRLKGKGTFDDTPLGRACFRSVCEDLYSEESDFENKVRLSIGFLDFAHRHKSSGTIFKRTGPGHVCLECAKTGGHGEIEVEYLEGMLLHWALTRVPINPRTDMEVDKSMSKVKTRKDDATTIVGEELAEDLDELENSVDKSEVGVVVKSEQDEDEAAETSDQDEASIDETEEVEVEKADPDPDDDEDEEEDDEDEAKEKSDIIVVETIDNLPAGGAISLEDVADNRDARQEAIRLHELWWDLGDVMYNIFERADVEDKQAAIKRAIEEFKDMLETKALLMLSEAEAEADATPLDQAFDTLKENIESAKADEDKTEDEVLESVQESFDTLGSVVVESVRGISEGSPAKSVAVDIEKAVTKALQPLTDQFGLLISTMGANAGVEVARSAIPKPRNLSVPPNATMEQPKPGSLRDIVRKSVGIV